jgi:hypothetical protein
LIDNDKLKAFAFAVLNHLQKFGAFVRRSRQCAVYVLVDYAQTAPLCESVTFFELPLNALIVLRV